MATSRYHICRTTQEIKQAVKACKSTGYVSIDFETNAEKLYNSTFCPTIVSVSFQPGSGIAIPLGHEDSPFKDNYIKVIKYIGHQLIEDSNIVKILWNAKYDLQIFEKYGIYSRGPILDGMLAKYILNEERPNGLKDMVRRYLPDFAGYEKYDGFDEIPWDKKPLPQLCEYGCMDTDATFRLTIFFERKMMDLGFYNLFRNLLMPASRVLQSAEVFGLPVDWELNSELHTKYEGLIDTSYKEILKIPQVRRFEKSLLKQRKKEYLQKIQAEIDLMDPEDPKDARKIKTREDKISRIMAGELNTKDEKKLIEPLNINSTKQLVPLMYTHRRGLKLPTIEYTKDPRTNRRTDTPSTGEDTILKLKEYDTTGFIDKLLEYRGYRHAYSTFIVGYRALQQEDNCMHPKFQLHTTVTGRLSSSDPNAQQIPKKEVNPDIKKQFIPPHGLLFLPLDYSQAELRIMAHLSGDETLLEAFQLGRDPHLAIACKKYGEDYDKILPMYKDETHPRYKEWKVKRKQAKQIVFGCIYGIQAEKLSQQLSDPKMGIKVTASEAQKFLNDFFQDQPRVKEFMDNQEKLMAEEGSVRSLFGRKRRCPGIYSESSYEVAEAARQSVNAPCQSAASDMTLFASVLIYWDIKQGKLPPMKEVSTVHDALYYFIPPEFINPWTIYKIYQICKNPDTKRYFDFEIDDVSMAVDLGVGRSMIEELPYTPGYDYKNLLDNWFDTDSYFKQHNELKSIEIDDYPKKFPQYFTKEFESKFRKQWINKFNQEDIWNKSA